MVRGRIAPLPLVLNSPPYALMSNTPSIVIRHYIWGGYLVFGGRGLNIRGRGSLMRPSRKIWSFWGSLYKAGPLI